MSTLLPEHARCRGCGYLLRGLAAPICPECGRKFDPADATTYQLRGRRRYGRIVLLLSALAAIGGLAFAFAPRGIYRGKMTFTCAECSEVRGFERWELKPPRWIAARYPALRFANSTSAPPAATSALGSGSVGVVAASDTPGRGSVGGVAAPGKSGAVAAAPTLPPDARSRAGSATPRACRHRTRSFAVDFGNRIVVRCTGNATPRPGGWPVVNGMKTTPENAEQVLAALMAPTNNGIRIGTAGGGWTVFDFLNAWSWVNERVGRLFGARRPPLPVD
ncbi:MAG: hypothetical protein AB7Q17_11015 [Phycisphaerae bacterium]